MLEFFEKCPGCGGALVITECRCTACGLEMRGEFRPPQFASLSSEQLTFIRIFLRARGNLSEVEKVLGISYPTIRNKLEEINQALDAAEQTPVPDPAQEERQAVLRQVADGRLSAADAVERLKHLPGGE